MEQELRYNILDIIRGTTVDGPGFRTSVYLAGCVHRCPHCHNPHSWDPDEGRVMTMKEIMQIIDEENFDVTLSGGDPLFYPEKTEALINEIKKKGRNIWLYTGYTWEEIQNDPVLASALRNVDVIVDGPFLNQLKSSDLPFRGSSNQRIIDVKESLRKGHPVIINR